jgi:predicted nucleic acid-binding Zn ribbon protein
MFTYTSFVLRDQLISPVNGYTCRRITKQNIKQFGFESIEDLHKQYPDFPLGCKEYTEKKSSSLRLVGSETQRKINEKRMIINNNKKILYQRNPIFCSKCGNSISYEKRNNKFCSKKCANSRGPRTEDFKFKVSEKLKGRKIDKEITRRSILTKGQIPSEDKPNTKCVICNCDTKSKNRKTCSDKCLRLNAKKNSQENPKCGGQKLTNRTKIQNNENQEFVAESSYEVRLSDILNSLNVKWIRPSYFWYKDKFNNKRRYYPDFYLPEYNLYLDPKNEYLINTDIDKIYRASNENKITVVILGNKSINDNTVKKLIKDKDSFLGNKSCVVVLS